MATDELISDFSDPLFQYAFMQYFKDLNLDVDDWPGIFREMNEEGRNLAYVRLNENGEVIGFIQFCTIEFTSWFFNETYGFIREFWVDEKYRNKGHGSELLKLAEKYLQKQGIYSFILTTDTAENFYIKNGYVKASGCRAKNDDNIYIKRLN